jgi:hypothetical protein
LRKKIVGLSYESRSHEYFGARSIIDLLHSWKRQVDFRALGHIAEEESKLARSSLQLDDGWGSGTMDDVEVWVAAASSIHGQFGAGFGCQLVLCLISRDPAYLCCSGGRPRLCLQQLS